MTATSIYILALIPAALALLCRGLLCRLFDCAVRYRDVYEPENVLDVCAWGFAYLNRVLRWKLWAGIALALGALIL